MQIPVYEMIILKPISKALVFLICSITELFFVVLLFITLNFGNTTLRTEYNLLHDRPVYYFVVRSGFGVLLSAVFAVLQVLFLIFGKRIMGIKELSNRKMFIVHLVIYSFLAMLFIVARFYNVLNSASSERVE